MKVANSAFIYYVFIALITCLLGFKVTVYHKDGDSTDMVKYDVTRDDVPPFQSNFDIEIDSTDRQQGPVVTGYLGNARSKRSTIDAETCMQTGNNMEKISNVVVVEKGESYHLPCHGCQEGVESKFESLQWIKLDPFPSSDGLYHVKEVISDMHSDDRRNRVIIHVDHTLQIKRTKVSDSGSYICARNLRHILNKRMSWKDIQRLILLKIQVQFYFHVDVLNLEAQKLVDVSDYSNFKPRSADSIPALNIAIETSWYPWNECNICGQNGLQKRIGICVIRKHHNQVTISNAYLESVLKTGSQLPCQSELLRYLDDDKIRNRLNEVQIRQCLVPCKENNPERERRSISASEILTGENKKDRKKKTKDVKVRDKDSLILVCPGSSVLTLAVWINGTKNLPLMELRNKTNKRISFDPIGNILFSPVNLGDAGVYSCWIKKKLRRKFNVKVTPNYSVETISYSKYLLFIFLGDFVVFVFLSVIKRLKRTRQVRRHGPKRVSSSEESASSGDESESGSSGS